MKILWHPTCGGVVAPPEDGAWALCRCGNSAIRLVDRTRVVAEAASRDGSRDARIIGLHNGYLNAGVGEALSDLSWRTRWALARSITPDHYLYARRESPLVVFEPGETYDSSWSEWPEPVALGPLFFPSDPGRGRVP